MENSMKFLVALLVVAAYAFLVPLQAIATEVKVIANPSVQATAISADDLKRIFLEEKRSLGDGTHVEPVLNKSGAAHDAFLEEFLSLNAEALQTYYRTLVFTGRGSMPKTFGSDAEIVAYVARTKGAIGYLSVGTNTEGVKTLTMVQAGNDAQRRLITRIEPVYPDTLKHLGIGGTVRLRITISAKGNVENVELLGGNPILGESAELALKQWVYAAGDSRTFADVSIPFGSRR
jgi:TonB family protein